LIRSFEGHPTEVKTVTISADRQTLLSCSKHELIMWGVQ
jgi:hypothetical protein